MKDLFQTPKLIPKNVKAILHTFNEDAGNTYTELQRLVNQIEPLGYTFDYYLDAEPYGLRPLNVKLNELEGYENMEEE